MCDCLGHNSRTPKTQLLSVKFTFVIYSFMKYFAYMIDNTMHDVLVYK